MIEVSEARIDPGALLNMFKQEAPDAGGVVTFTGTVRPDATDGAVTSLHLQAYSPMTERSMAAAVADTRARWKVDAIRVHHRIGTMAPGDTIVFVAVASKHRREAFEAADFLMDYLKTRAVFWKKETTSQGARWIEPRAQDYEDNARWEKRNLSKCME